MGIPKYVKEMDRIHWIAAPVIWSGQEIALPSLFLSISLVSGKKWFL